MELLRGIKREGLKSAAARASEGGHAVTLPVPAAPLAEQRARYAAAAIAGHPADVLRTVALDQHPDCAIALAPVASVRLSMHAKV